jgi:hypothetical protein
MSLDGGLHFKISTYPQKPLFLYTPKYSVFRQCLSLIILSPLITKLNRWGGLFLHLVERKQTRNAQNEMVGELCPRLQTGETLDKAED